MVLLSEQIYHKAGAALDSITFNNLFARAVVDQKASGKIYADNEKDPRTFYIVHRYGMSLLLGDCMNSEFNTAFRSYALNLSNERNDHEWMQVFPDKWNIVLKELFGPDLITSKDNKAKLSKSVVELNTRVNFKFHKEKFISASALRKKDPKVDIKESTQTIYNQMDGLVVPKNFWNSAEDFAKNCVSFSLYYDGKLAATAFPSFFAPGKLELAIETIPEFRSMGLAELVCARLIEYCIEHDLEPVWACRLENTGSYMLALKLGFTPAIELPYYRLSK